MTVLVLTAVSIGLRGDITRWLIEVAPGVFVGKISRRVRDHLWDRVRDAMRHGNALMICNARTEQGWHITTLGEDRWKPVDYDGLVLMTRPTPP